MLRIPSLVVFFVLCTSLCSANTEIINFHVDTSPSPAADPVSSFKFKGSIPILTELTQTIYPPSNLSWNLSQISQGPYTARLCWSARHSISAKLSFEPPNALLLSASFASVFAQQPPVSEIHVPFTLLVEPLIFGFLPKTSIPLVIGLALWVIIGSKSMSMLKTAIRRITTT